MTIEGKVLQTIKKYFPTGGRFSKAIEVISKEHHFSIGQASSAINRLIRKGLLSYDMRYHWICQSLNCESFLDIK